MLTVFHGMTADFDAFTDDFVGNGNDQEGPGIYLTTDEADAQFYCRGNGVLYTVEMELRKTVSTKRKASKREVEKMMRAAPDLDDTLQNWDENKGEAFRQALAAMLKNEPAHAAFQSVWYDFYRNAPVQYLRNMVGLLGYDGVIVPKEKVTHFIVFNPAVLRIVSKRKIGGE